MIASPGPHPTRRPGRRSKGPRFLAHRGTVHAAGFVFDSGLIGVAEARRRILSLWSAGSRVYRVDDEGRLLVLVLPATADVATDHAPGIPLVHLGGAIRPGTTSTLESAPLTPEEIERIAPPPGSIVLVRGGETSVVTLSQDRSVDPAGWLDLADWEAVETVSLGRIPEAPKPAVEEVRADVREILTGIPPASEEAEDFAAALRGYKVRRKRRALRFRFSLLAGPTAAKQLLGVLAAVGQAGRSAVSAAAGAASRWRKRRAERAVGSSGHPRRSPGHGPGSNVPSAPTGQASAAADAFTRALLFVFDPVIVAAVWLQLQIERVFPPPAGSVRHGSLHDGRRNNSGMPESWTLKLLGQLGKSARALSARMLFGSGLAQMLGRRQAAHLSRMMKMFRDGNLDEALRHAVPLGGAHGLEVRLALRMPGARDSLAIQLGRGPSAMMLASGPELFEELRKIYRGAFEQLEQAGRIDEAAFVLAELLHADEEAVQFLEKHGKAKLAAELAEARSLPPGLVVRQWWVAKQWERALIYARRMGAFADALMRLEKTAPSEAAKLRLLWADSLAEAGDYSAAVETVWPLVEARNLAVEWIDLGIAVGGPASGRLLARKLALMPESFADVRIRVMELMDDTSEEQVPVRRSFSFALFLGSRTDAAQALARLAIRALIRDSSVAIDPLPEKDFRRLVDFAGDSALRGDLPPLPRASRNAWPEARETRVIHIEASDTGTAEIYDAAMLPGGKMLVALGEAGLRLLNREGRTVVHWDQPAHHLVMSDRGDRAIFHSPRGESARLGRVDLAARKAAYWCDAPLSCWARDFDGSGWFVASGRDFAMVDATATGWTSMWSRAGLGPTVRDIARSGKACWALTTAVEQTDEWGNRTLPHLKRERWMFTLPGPVLEKQVGAPDPFGSNVVERREWRTLNGEGHGADLNAMPIEQNGQPTGRCAWELFIDGPGDSRLNLGVTTPIHAPFLAFTGEWCAVMIPDVEAPRIGLVRIRTTTSRLNLTLAGASTPSIRLTREHLLVADDRGRLVAMHLQSGNIIRNLRLYI